MPFDHSPRIFDRWMSRPSGMTVPMVASGTRSPGAMLNAPQQICSDCPSPTSTNTSPMRSAFGCFARSSTRATITPGIGSPTIVTDSTAMPSWLSAVATASASPPKSA